MPHDQMWLDEEAPEVTPPVLTPDDTKRMDESNIKLTPKRELAAELDPRTNRIQCNALVDDSHKYTDVLCNGMPGVGGAPMHYAVTDKSGREVARLSFHEGPLAGENAGPVKGLMNENLIAIVADRIDAFQSGKYANDYNAVALEHLRAALKALSDRTAHRESEGKEGTHAV